jgi:hypothetical protein
VAVAFSEQTLARILIAGTGLSVKKQCRLLRTLAHAVDPPPPSPRPRTSAAKRRAAGRVRWRRWAQRHNSGHAIAPVTYNAISLAKLIMAGWLPRNAAELYPAKAVGEAISTLLQYGDLPPKKNLLTR